VEGLFNTAREGDYRELAGEARRLQTAVGRSGKRALAARRSAMAALVRLRKRLGEVGAIDFFRAPGREVVEGLLDAIEGSLRPAAAAGAGAPAAAAVEPVRGRTWVTRRGVQVDRIASAWLIRRFIDPEARFAFVDGGGHRPAPGELRFDMFEAEFTHEGDQCTFEVLVRRFGLGVTEPALRPIAEIIHDVDLKDGKFARPEAVGLERLIAGIAGRHPDDEARLRDGAVALEGLYDYFARRR
ncbi:MAG TPA: chromate resistance protein ChrB domain-containing protein, partial [Vicinamibacteria bacterium]